MSFPPKISFFVLKLERRKSSGKATKSVVGEADAFDLPSHLCSPIISEI
jgi:hypothetical protein